MWDYFYPPPDIQGIQLYLLLNEEHYIGIVYNTSVVCLFLIYILVIQATPKTSPCPSERCAQSGNTNECCHSDGIVSGGGGIPSGSSNSAIGNRRRKKPQKSLSEQESFDYIAIYPETNKYDEIEEEEAESAVLAEHISRLNRNNRILETSLDTFNSSLLTRRAPLASLSSFKISSIDYQDSDLRSLGSDSVFVESYADTDDDMEQFSTDSNEESDALCPPNTRSSRSAANRVTSSYHRSTVCADIELKPRELPGDAKDLSAHLSGEKKHSSLFKSNQSVYSNRSLKARLCSEPLTKVATTATQQTTSRNGARIFTTSTSKTQPREGDLSALKSTKRPASYSGSTTNSLSLHQCSSNNIRNDDNIYLSNDINRSSKSTGNMIEGLMLLHESIAPVHQQKQHQQHQQHRQCQHLADDNQTLSSCSTSSRNNQLESVSKINVVTSNVVDNRQRQSTVSPSVILELPVIVSTQEQLLGDKEQQPISDPNLPGPSRKWSKETLF